MPIARLIKKEYFVLTGKERSARTVERCRKQNVAAFGMAEPLVFPLLVDVVAVNIADELVRYGIGRKEAAAVVRGYFDHWITCVSRVEHNGDDCFFAVMERGDDDWRVISGRFNVPDPEIWSAKVRCLVIVSIKDIMEAIKERAKEAGVELTGSFFLPDDHPVFQQWIDDFRKWREQALRPGAGRKMRKIPMVEGMACRVH